MRLRVYSITLLSTLAFAGCGLLYHIDETPMPSITFPEKFAGHNSPTDSQFDLNKPWWFVYGDEHLNKLVQQALTSNYSLQAAWERLKQSQAILKMNGAEQYPNISINTNASRTRSKNSIVTTDSNGEEVRALTTSNYNDFGLGGNLSYQIDLWNRVNSSVESSELLVNASRADAENTALILSGTITELWTRAQEQKATIRLVREQVKASQRLLKLTKMRFQMGQSSALDVYQQQSQLTATQAELPRLKAALKRTLHQLAILTGQVPSAMKLRYFSGKLPELPPIPNLSSPATLLESRPDLRAMRDRLKSAQFDIASAFANKFPSIGLSLSYNFSAEKIADLFTGHLAQMFGSIAQPLIDGGRLDAAVEEREANWRAMQLTFTESVLTALQDVENALLDEKERLQLLEIQEEQIKYAEATLRESRNRYLNGLTDYLQVTLATQSLQALQRNQISNRSELILARSRLYLSLGGAWTSQLTQNGEASS